MLVEHQVGVRKAPNATIGVTRALLDGAGDVVEVWSGGGGLHPYNYE